MRKFTGSVQLLESPAYPVTPGFTTCIVDRLEIAGIQVNAAIGNPRKYIL
jgi:hypothetical protein